MIPGGPFALSETETPEWLAYRRFVVQQMKYGQQIAIEYAQRIEYARARQKDIGDVMKLAAQDKMPLFHGDWIKFDVPASRNEGIGASEAAAVIGMSTYRSALDVWNVKTGRVPPIKDTEAMYWGRKVERLILQRYMDDFDHEKRKASYVMQPGMIALAYSRVFASPDLVAVFEREGHAPTFRVIEAKNVGPYMRDAWGKPGSDDVPTEYLIQVQMQMHVLNLCGMKCEDAIIAVLFNGNEYAEYRVAYNRRMAGTITERCCDFYKNHVLTDIPPTTMPPPKEIKAIIGKVLVATEDDMNDYIAMRTAIADQRDAVQRAKTYGDKIRTRLGDASALVSVNGVLLATYNNTSEKHSIDVDALLRENPSIDVAKYTIKSPGVRRLILKDE